MTVANSHPTRSLHSLEKYLFYCKSVNEPKVKQNFQDENTFFLIILQQCNTVFKSNSLLPSSDTVDLDLN